MRTFFKHTVFFAGLSSSLLAMSSAFSQTDMYGRDIGENQILSSLDAIQNSKNSEDRVAYNLDSKDVSQSFALQSYSQATLAVDAPVFTVGVAYKAGRAGMEAVDVGDVDGDGDLEVIALSGSSSDQHAYRVFVFHPSDLGLGVPQSYEYTGGTYRPGLSIADLDGDNTQEIIIGQRQGISVLSWNGLGNFEEQVYGSTKIDTLDAVDIDLDNDLDVVGLPWRAPAYQFFNEAGNIFSHTSLSTFASGYNDQAIGDLNNDGLDDLVVMSGQSYATPNFSVHAHNGEDGFLPAQSYFVGTNELTRGVGIGDFNGDGLNDVVLSRGRNSPTHLWVYTQNTTGDLVGPVTVPSYDIPQKIASADIDQNGYDDIVVLHGGWRRMGVYLNSAEGFGEEILVTIPYASHYRAESLRLADLDQDGCAETFLVAEYNQGVYPVYSNLCEEISTPVTESVIASLEQYWEHEVEIEVSGGTIELSATYVGGNIDLFVQDENGEVIAWSLSDDNPETLSFDTQGQAGVYHLIAYNKGEDVSNFELTYTYLP